MKKFLLVVLACISLTTIMGCGQYSDGTRTGTLIKFSKKGLVWKTWEGTMNLGGTKTESHGKGQTSIVANTWDFTITDPALAEKLKEMVGQDAEVNYNQEVIVAPWRGDTTYIVNSVK